MENFLILVFYLLAAWTKGLGFAEAPKIRWL
jgi:hypothetical protein